MAKASEINLQFGSRGLAIENEQDPNSTDPTALTNAPEGSLKHAVDVGYYGGKNLKRREGYEDLWHEAEAKTVELTLSALTAEPTTGDIITQNAPAALASMRVLSADAATNTIIGIIAGVFGGMMMVYVNGSLFRKKSFRFAILTTLTAYSSIFIFISVAVPSFMILLKINVFGDITMTFMDILPGILSLLALSNFLLWGMVVILTILFVAPRYSPFQPHPCRRVDR